MKPSPIRMRMSRGAIRGAPRPVHHASTTKNGAEYSMRSASSATGSTGAQRYASLIRIALNENPSTPRMASSAPIPLALRPVDDAHPGSRENKQPERDPIPGERDEIVPAHIADQPAHAKERRDEGGDEADREALRVERREQRAIPDEVVDAGREERRDREEEREFRRGRARKAEQHAADDRRAGSRRSGDQRQRLRAADLECIGPAHRIDAIDPYGRRRKSSAALDPQDDERADDEGQRDRDRREQVALDGAREEQAEYCRGQECDEQVEHETLRERVVAESGDGADQPRAIFPAHREDRASLDHDLEHLGALAGVAEQRSGDDQVARGRDGQEFGETLDDAQDQGNYGGRVIQRRRSEVSGVGTACDCRIRKMGSERIKRARRNSLPV